MGDFHTRKKFFPEINNSIQIVAPKKLSHFPFMAEIGISWQKIYMRVEISFVFNENFIQNDEKY